MNRLPSVVVSLIAAIAITASAQQKAPVPARNPAEAIPANKPELPRRTGSIEGRIRSDDRQPLVKIEIQVNKIGLARNAAHAVGIDDEGKFVIDNLAPGAYSISASAPGYVLASEGGEQRYYRPGDKIDLTLTKGGVITGTVTRSTGEPVVAARVQAIRVRDIEGRPLRRPITAGSQYTDDRGAYRIYGLQPGSYLVVTGASSAGYSSLPAQYEKDVPTYYPSATRSAATEVTVNRGQEVTGIDIQYRGERGHSISGSVLGTVPAEASGGIFSLTLTHADGGFTVATMSLSAQRNPNSFAFHGLADGEYELVALSNFSSGEGGASPPIRVTVRGADVTGLELKLAPLGRVAGRVILETSQGTGGIAGCKDDRKSLLEETVITAHLDEKRDRKDERRADSSYSIASAPDSKGEFMLRNLYAARYHIETLLPNKNWYIRAINLPGNGGRLIDAARNGLTLKSGERVKDMTITAVEGAASLSGRVVPFAEGDRLPDRLRAHLIPAEPERADDPLRFAETAVQRDGAFAFTNIAPGRYRLVALPVPDEEPGDPAPRPIAWDGEGRASLRREAESSGTEIELQPCQRVTDNILRYKKPAPRNSRPPKKNL